ncbi:hypothetical protein DLAC_05899 [Tieghemostelium lacteum]|uniref:Tenascin X n=1 Tax=Tieghemostelium lacteum TaxID=361077 RepID=A0A151ZH51_TIELA|nr:hypothetical protein DLAC_05899 [Tieghemostelium lacteum]|eukprot:KYQ93247.1 hypothetical protein DLAC_05899 [Tieghemostelium lacteum]
MNALRMVDGCDFNGDGVADIIQILSSATLIFFSGTNNTVYNINSLNGSNGFGIQSASGFGSYNTDFKCGDINDDGYDDIVYNLFNSYPNTNGSVAVIYGAPNYTKNIFTIPTDVDGVNSFFIKGTDNEAFGHSRAIMDFNRDGILDMVIGNFPFHYAPSTNNSTTIRKRVIYGLASGSKFPVNSAYEFDINSLDGLNGFTIEESNRYYDMTSADVNNDGWDDLISYNSPTISNILIITGPNTLNSSTFTPQYDGIHGSIITTSSSTLFKFETKYPSIAVGDFNADGLNDLFILVENSKTIYIIYGKKRNQFLANESNYNIDLFNSMDDGVIFTTTRETNLNKLCTRITVGDLNNDGISDLTCGSTYNSGSYFYKYWVIFGTGLPIYASSIPISFNSENSTFFNQQCRTAIMSANSYSFGAIRDFNGDGIADLHVGEPNSIDSFSYVIYGSSYYSTYTLPSSIRKYLHLKDNLSTPHFNIPLFNESFIENDPSSQCKTSHLLLEISSSSSSTSQSPHSNLDRYQFEFTNINTTIYSKILSNNNRSILIYTTDINSSVISNDVIRNLFIKAATATTTNDTITITIKYQGISTPITYILDLSISDISTSTTTTTASSSIEETTTNKKKTNIGVIIGPILGGVFLLALAIFTLFIIKKKSKKAQKTLRHQTSMTKIFSGGKVQDIDKF